MPLRRREPDGSAGPGRTVDGPYSKPLAVSHSTTPALSSANPAIDEVQVLSGTAESVPTTALVQFEQIHNYVERRCPVTSLVVCPLVSTPVPEHDSEDPEPSTLYIYM